MATNEILTTASVDNGTNLQTQSEYSADAQRPTGQSSGVARSKFINKTLRQLSVVAAGVAQFIAERQTTNITDSLTPAAFASVLEASLIGRNFATAGGTVDAVTLAMTPTQTGFPQSDVAYWRATGANTNTAVTVKRDGLAAKTLIKGNNQPLVVGDIPGAGALMASVYDVALDKEVLLNPATGVSAGGGQQPGEICYFARNTAPVGFLKANGATISRSTYAALFAAIYKTATVTMTIATPGVISWAGHTLVANDSVQFTSTGVLPTGFVTATNYYVVGASIVAGVSFQLSATPGGAAIATSGSQSGIHTAHNAPFGIGDGSTTFNVPELRGEFLRGWDDGRGVDSNRAFGSGQLDAMQGHVHGGGYSGFNDRSGGSGGTPNLRSDGVSPNTTTPITDGSNGTPRTSTETRGRNVPLLACIKY